MDKNTVARASTKATAKIVELNEKIRKSDDYVKLLELTKKIRDSDDYRELRAQFRIIERGNDFLKREKGTAA